ncbi:MAG: lytic murein transglycosylase B [Burkholderiales bacterium]|nr:lytic murein transglycosylase B [Burkholderiales bacterium]
MPVVLVKLLVAGCLAFLFPLAITAAAGEPSTAAPSSAKATTKAAPAQAKPRATGAPAKATAKSGPKSHAKPAAKASTRTGYAARDDVRAFATEVARDTDLPRRDIERWLAAAKYQPKIVELMDRPLLEPPKWYAYSASFLTPARIDAGVRFWRDNAGALARAEAIYGVPPEIVVAIIGVETFYGRNTGSHRVIDALATLAFDYPRRATFFRGELKEYLVLARAQDFSPLVPKGSYAGAMGLPQFMPGSYRRFAVDFDGDGHADLWRNPADAIGSVANYLARHDWQRGAPVLTSAAVGGDALSAVLRRLDGGISERRPLAAWEADGVDLRDGASTVVTEPVGVLLLEESADGATSLWIAYPNFYVITRYNKSRLYAAAVWALAERLRAQYLGAR